MAAYLIGDVNVTDAAAFEEYRQMVPATEEKYGGHYLGRGGARQELSACKSPWTMTLATEQSWRGKAATLLCQSPVEPADRHTADAVLGAARMLQLDAGSGRLDF